MIKEFIKGKWLDSGHTKFSCNMITDYYEQETEYFLTIDDPEFSELTQEQINSFEDVTTYVPTDDEVKHQIVSAVQSKLDQEAQSKGYDNGFACASYATSSVPSFKNEAESFIEWRDTCWCLCYDLLEKYLQGSIPRPTVDDVLNKLPNMEWA